jgi:uncharacterized protein YcaQ
MSSLHRLRALAISQSLFPAGSLKAAIEKLGFVQADPIRSPARAQDLILRHRVDSYRTGDLERHYPLLEVEEDFLYAYGFMPRKIWRLIHPRDTTRLTKLEKRVLDLVSRFGPTHPNRLDEHLGRKRVVNAWGGFSRATTSALEDLHYRGLLRIARRDNGIRVYELAPVISKPAPPSERLRKLIMVVTNLLSPVPEKTLRANVFRYRHLGNPRKLLHEMFGSGELRKETIDGLSYVWPSSATDSDLPASQVRFLAPFDPVVWDRLRFEHLWGWPYRFEAYTPASKRIRGYYAMPLLWGHDIVGWANANLNNGHLNVDVGFAGKRPRDKRFNLELDAEISRMETFLGEIR